jgi:nitroreductase
MIYQVNTLNEAEFKGKDVSLNKPKRGGSKAYYVYVRDPKTKKVKKVSFGSGGLRAKIKNKEARNAFAARHNCKDKKDRTSPGWWSCNLPKYAQALGLGANMQTFW